MTNRRILLTGGTGFIGLWLAQALAECGDTVTLLDIRPLESTFAPQFGFPNANVEFVQDNIVEPSKLFSLGCDFSHIVNAASVLGVATVAKEPISTIKTAVVGTLHCLEFAVHQRSLQMFLQFSTSEVYGPEADSVTTDNSAVIPTDGLRWCYASSKLTAEFLVKGFNAEHGVPAHVVRPFNVYGPFRNGENAITRFVSNAIQGKPITVHRDGQDTRSWCYISDFVSALVTFLTLPLSERPSVFNLGNSEPPITTLALAQCVKEVLKSESPIVQIEGTPSRVRSRCPAADFDSRFFNGTRRVSLDEGIHRTASWLREQIEIPDDI